MQNKPTSETSEQDRIYAQPFAKVDDFVFDENVVKVFPDMIKRSVPGYATIIHMIGQMAERYCQADTNCYDLGCSLGAATLAMRHRIRTSNSKVIAVDNSQDMLDRCQHLMDADPCDIPVELVHADIANITIEHASVVVLNFTLQFVPREQREALLSSIFKGMVPGGILIVSEKINFDNPEHEALMTEFHHYFKKTNGYSDLEIAQKRNAIENVLIPESFSSHKARLEKIGFRSVDLWFQCFNFASFIAFTQY